MFETIIETALGPVPIRHRGAGGRLVVVIRGAFPTAIDDYEWLDADDAEFAFLHLPAFFSRVTSDISIATFTAALDAAIVGRYGARTCTAVGVSAGSLVALGLSTAKAALLIEPFVTTGALWPLFEQQARVGNSELARRWFAGVFGEPGIGRDYSDIWRRARLPVTALLGDLPLEPVRRLTRMPSLCSAADRAFLAGLDNVQSVETPGGHDLSVSARDEVLAGLSSALGASSA